MKLLPVLLLQCVTAAAAVFVYDQLRDDTPPVPTVHGRGDALAADTPDLGGVERRLRTLEGIRTPTLAATGSDPGLLARVEALEAALEEVLRARAPAVASEEERASEAEDAAPAGGLAAPGVPTEPSREDVQRFRLLREAARREDELQKNRERVNGMLDKARITLSARQREQVQQAYAAFQPRVTEIWTEAKQQAQATIAAGGTVERGEVVANTQALIQQAFVSELEQAAPGVDATAVAEALVSGRK